MDGRCSQCQTQLSHSAAGDYCLQCGVLFHHQNFPDANEKKIRITHSFAPTTPSAIIDSIVPPATVAAVRPIITPVIDPTTVRLMPAPPEPQRITRADVIRTTPLRKAPAEVRQPWKITLIWLGSTAAIALFVFASVVANHPTQPRASVASAQLQAAASVDPTPDSNAVARDSVRKQDINEIATALSVYQAQNGSYPIGNDITALNTLQFSNPPYINRINYDPSSDAAHGKIVSYGYSSDGQHYRLFAKLENSNDPQSQKGAYILRN